MGQTRTFRHSFAGGEVAPELEARLDDSRHQQGLSLCRNLLPYPQGQLDRRRGTEFVAEAVNVGALSRLIPFDFSSDQQLMIEIAAGKFRFHIDGAPVLASATSFVLTKPINSVNITPGVMQANFLAAHGFLSGDGVTFGLAPGATIIGGMALYTVYYAIVVDSTHLQFADTRANALAGNFLSFSGTGSTGGVQYVHRVYEVGESFGYPSSGGSPFITTVRSLAGYTPPLFGPVTAAFSTITNRVSSTSHGLFQGSPVIFALNGGTLPPEVTPGVVYYALPVNANDYQISTTYGPGPAVTFSVASTGAPTMIRQVLFVAPSTPAYEIDNHYLQPDLMELNYHQSNDVVTISHPSYPLAELRRLSNVHWQFVDVGYSTLISPPTGLSGGTVPGEVITMVSAARIAQGISFEVLSVTQIVSGSVILWGTSGTFTNTAATEEIAQDTFYIVGEFDGTSGKKFVLRFVDTGLPVDFADPFFTVGTVVGTPTFRITSLAAERTHLYQVTAVDADGRETLPSSTLTITNVLDVRGAQNLVTWNTVAGASRYRVYKSRNGLFAFLGQVEHVAGQATFTFTDDQTLVADLGQTVPRQDMTLGAGDNPRSSCDFEERRMFGGTRGLPQTLLGSVTGTQSDLTYHIPVQDSDRINREMGGIRRMEIRHLVPLGDLLVLTNNGEWRVTSRTGGAITPENITARQQSGIGCSEVSPAVISNTVLFAGINDGHIYEFGFSQDSDGYVPGDLCVRAPHLFDNYRPLDMGFARARLQSAWVCSSSGLLLGMTYLPAEEVGAWHKHETRKGSFESCCVVKEDGVDSIYLCVKRTVNSVEKHYIERLRLKSPGTDKADWFFVDSGLSFTNNTGVPVNLISNLDHLAGEDVVALIDGVVQPETTVSLAGEIALTTPLAVGKTVHVGLRMIADGKTLPATLNSDQAYGQSRAKNVTHAVLKVLGTSRFKVGATEALLKPTSDIVTGEIHDGLVRVLAAGTWTEGGQLMFRQEDPLPFRLVALVLEITYGGG